MERSQICMFYLIFCVVELELKQPETLKNEAFGASHRTYQLIPQVLIYQLAIFILPKRWSFQVYELVVKVPTPPLSLTVMAGVLSFSSPEFVGGSNIKNYQVCTHCSNHTIL